MHSIFFNNITCLDHGYIDNTGHLRGGSFHVSVIVSSAVLDDQDHTVVDFSSGKKMMKNLIDDMALGYDHKTWVIPGYSKIDKFDGSILETPTLRMTAPTTAYRQFEFGSDYSYISVGQELSTFLKQHIPEFDFNVIITEEFFGPACSATFRYVHGLFTSVKSLGCQNIGHGHLSFVCAYNDYEKSKVIADDLHNTVFSYDVNVISETDDQILLKYSTKERGEFTLLLDKNQYKIVILPTESTVENLVEYVANKYSITPGNLLLSEGLSKGSII